MNILLVDDSPDVRLLLHKILKDAGYGNTISTSTAYDVFKKLNLEHGGAGSNEIDLIVMDVRMPEIDGRPDGSVRTRIVYPGSSQRQVSLRGLF